MNKQLDGKHILVTGAAGGVGKVLCHVLSERGAKVCGLDINANGLAELPQAITTLQADLTKYAELAEKLTAYQQEQNNFNALVNNAAFTHDQRSLHKTEPAKWADEVNINLNGTYNVTTALLPSLQTNAGAIVTIASVNAQTSLGHPAYSAAKAGMIAYTQAVAMEYGQYGIRANVILPGTISTEAWQSRQQQDPEVFTKLKQWYPLKKIVQPEQIAYAVSFLLSDEASAISGAQLNVDCGLMAGQPPFAEAVTLEQMS